jgi:hypothetical protein
MGGTWKSRERNTTFWLETLNERLVVDGHNITTGVKGIGWESAKWIHVAQDRMKMYWQAQRPSVFKNYYAPRS